MTTQEFWLTVVKTETCWLCWAGNNGNGYRRVKWNGKMIYVHRLAYILTKGDPGTKMVRHTCDNRQCVNPEHLILGTHQDNMDDRTERNDYLKGSRHHQAVLTEDLIRSVRLRLKNGESGRSIARDLGIGESHVSQIRHRLIWRHVE